MKAKFKDRVKPLCRAHTPSVLKGAALRHVWLECDMTLHLQSCWQNLLELRENCHSAETYRATAIP